jgi:hypothetical protein
VVGRSVGGFTNSPWTGTRDGAPSFSLAAVPFCAMVTPDAPSSDASAWTIVQRDVGIQKSAHVVSLRE